MLELVYATKEEIREGFESLYTERDGKWHLTGVKGIKTQADVDAVQEALRKEREEHKATKEAQRAPGDEDFKERVAAEVAKRTRDLQRQIGSLTARAEEAESVAEESRTAQRQTNLRSHLMSKAREHNVLPTAMADVFAAADLDFETDDDGNVITKHGGTAADWFEQMKLSRPHWWPLSSGTGGRGNNNSHVLGIDNPWTRDGWNVTRQSQMRRERGDVHARNMAQAAGSRIGATTPPHK